MLGEKGINAVRDLKYLSELNALKPAYLQCLQLVCSKINARRKADFLKNLVGLTGSKLYVYENP